MRTSEDKRNRVFPPISLKNGVKMEFGDTRGDVHPGFTMITTAFLRYVPSCNSEVCFVSRYPEILQPEITLFYNFCFKRKDIFICFRNHNHIARNLKVHNPHWSEEQLFQEARSINVALVQHVTYTDFLDALLGTPNDVCVSRDALHEDFYDRTVDGTINMGFSTAGYRLHTLISDKLDCRDKNYRVILVMLILRYESCFVYLSTFSCRINFNCARFSTIR